jgi:hypothetical protein
MHQHAKRIVNGLVELIGSNLRSNHHPQEVCTYLYVCDKNKRWNYIFSTRSGALSTDFYAQMGAEANQTTIELDFLQIFLLARQARRGREKSPTRGIQQCFLLVSFRAQE